MNISPGTLIVLIFAVLFGVAGAYTVREHLKTPPPAVLEAPQPQDAPEEIVYVPTSSNELPANRALTLSDIAIYKYTRPQVREKNIGPFMSNPDQIVGRVLKAPLKKGEVFRADSFFPEGMMQSVTHRLQKGHRAVTIPVQGTGVLDGLVDSSAHVDVIFRTAAAAGVPQRTVNLVEDVEVLAVDRNTVPGSVNSADSATVTLAVDARQAHALKVAEGRGDFSLTLRALEDDIQHVATGPETLESLLDLPPTQFKAEIFRGTQRETVEMKVDPRDLPRRRALPLTSAPPIDRDHQDHDDHDEPAMRTSAPATP